MDFYYNTRICILMKHTLICSSQDAVPHLCQHFYHQTLCVRSVTSYSLQPARLLCPWNFPGKYTGVGCHVLCLGIFPTQGPNLRLFDLLHWQAPPVKPIRPYLLTNWYRLFKWYSTILTWIFMTTSEAELSFHIYWSFQSSSWSVSWYPLPIFPLDYTCQLNALDVLDIYTQDIAKYFFLT